MKTSMKTIQYGNETYWQVTETSAIRPHKKDRLRILTIGQDGVKCVSRTVKPSLREIVVSMFHQGGIA